MGFVDAQREERGEEPRATPGSVEAVPNEDYRPLDGQTEQAPQEQSQSQSQ